MVAALTIPSLITKIENIAFKTAFKKQISNFAQAMETVQFEDEFIFDELRNDWAQSPVFICKIQQQMKALKSGLDCSTVLGSNFNSTAISTFQTDLTWHKDSEWYDKRGEEMRLNIGYNHNTFLLPDGALINFNCTTSVFVDVNGYKKPNTVGKDIFYFNVSNKGVTPFSPYTENTTNVNSCTTSDKYI